MRVNFIGNLANNHYILAKGLRGLGIDARLYYQDNGFHSLPQADDPELANSPLPDWLVPVGRQYKRWQPSYHMSRELLDELKQCDILHAHGPGLIWAAQTGRPFIWHPYGSDLTYLTAYSRDLCLTKAYGRGPIPNFPNIFLPLKMKWAIRRSSAVLFGWHNALWRDGYQLLHRLGVDHRIRRYHLAIDTGRFSPAEEAERMKLRAELLPGVNAESPLIFHPTRQNFSTNTTLGYKANDQLYRALGRFARNGKKFTLLIVENGLPDEQIARRILSEENISQFVHWIAARPRNELVKWYRAADMTVESFWTGAIGSVPLKSMACGTAVMMHLQTEAEPEDKGYFLDPKDLYGELPPIIRCATIPEIEAQLYAVTKDHGTLRHIGRDSRRWVEQFTAAPVMAQRLLTLYRSVLSDRAAASLP